MRKIEFTYRSSDQKTQIHAIKWEPEKRPRAIIQIVHDMAEYINRYESFARMLAACGIMVVGNDHLGHGESVSTDIELGYFAEKDGDSCVVKDLYHLGETIRTANPGVPYFLFGQGTGSFFVRRYLCEYESRLDGVILSGTGQNSHIRAKCGMLLTRLIRIIHGWHYRSRMLDRLIVGSMNDAFQPARTPRDWLTRDEAVVDAYIKNPKCGFQLTLNGYYYLFRMMNQLEKPELLRNMNKDIPILFLAGAEDPAGDFGKSVRQVAADFRELGMKQVDCIIYSQYRHEILNELGKEAVYKDVARWIAARLEDRLYH